MTQDSVKSDLKLMVAEQLGGIVSPNEIDEDASLFSADVGLCSMDGVELLTRINERFHVDLLPQFTAGDEPTINSIAKLVEGCDETRLY